MNEPDEIAQMCYVFAVRRGRISFLLALIHLKHTILCVMI